MMDELNFAVEYSNKIGAEFTEARAEDVSKMQITLKNGEIKEITTDRLIGIGVKIIHKGAQAYSFTSKFDKDSIKQIVEQAFKAAKVAGSSVTAPLKPLGYEGKSGTYEYNVKTRFDKVEPEEKKNLVIRFYDTAKDLAKNVVQITSSYGELFGKRYFLNSEGISYSLDLFLTGLNGRILSKVDGELVAHGESEGAFAGFEYWTDSISVEKLATETATILNKKQKAKSAPAGKFRALVENRLAGVLAHESFGHLTEGDFVMGNLSPLAGKLGEKLGSTTATIIDEGTPKVKGFWLPIDDEGVKTTKTVLLKKGVLVGYLNSRETANMLDKKLTGNARAVSIRFPPIPRMKNTYFAPGDLKVEEKLELLKNGIYAVKTFGGQVEMDGNFMFKTAYAYKVENGEITDMYKEAILTGNILDFLKNIEGAFNDLKIYTSYFGGCGKGGQFPLPVGLGGPHLLLKKVHFGGEKA